MTVLLADEIHKLCDGSNDSTPMIEPYSACRLRPASYQLTLGKEVHVGGKHKHVDQSDGIILPPHQVAVVSTRETLRIPRDVIARWSLRVTNIYEGLLWTGGPQVDPGWEGPLFCPIYNLAERTIVLKYGDPLFTIDFVRTTPVTAELEKLKCDPEKYPKVWFTPQRRTLAEHDIHRLQSAPHEVLERLREMETELQKFREIGYGAIGLMFTVLAIMVAALAVVAVGPTARPDGPFLSFWPMTALVGSAVAMVLSGATALMYCKMRTKWFSAISRLSQNCKTDT